MHEFALDLFIMLLLLLSVQDYAAIVIICSRQTLKLLHAQQTVFCVHKFQQAQKYFVKYWVKKREGRGGKKKEPK